MHIKYEELLDTPNKILNSLFEYLDIKVMKARSLNILVTLIRTENMLFLKMINYVHSMKILENLIC